MIGIILASRAKSGTSVTILTSLATKLIGVMSYMVVLLDFVWLLKLVMCKLLLW